MSKLIEVLKTGKHVDANGVPVTFTEEDLRAIASSYDPKTFEAPLVVGHPNMDDPAYGWASKFVVQGGVLCAEPTQVDEQFSGLVNAGRFKKVSISLYAPDAPANPKPGSWYPRHIGFLGAHAPAIKGLRSVSFADASTEGVVTFGAYGGGLIVTMLRNLREYIIGEKGVDTADGVIPNWMIDSAQSDIDDNPDSTLPVFAEPAPSKNTLTPEKPPVNVKTPEQIQAELDAANSQLQAAREEIAARDSAAAKAAATARRAEALAFAESLVASAKLPASEKELVATICEKLATPDAAGATVMFGEGADAKPALDGFKALLGGAKPSVEFGEFAKQGAGDSAKDPSVIAAKARAHVEAEAEAGRTISIAEAVNFVERQS